MNDFEEQKQEISLKLTKRLIKSNQPIVAIWLEEVINDVNNLQPPKPPTCATCHNHNGADFGACDGFKDPMQGIEIPDVTAFGCTNHSDYEVEE